LFQGVTSQLSSELQKVYQSVDTTQNAPINYKAGNPRFKNPIVVIHKE